MHATLCLKCVYTKFLNFLEFCCPFCYPSISLAVVLSLMSRTGSEQRKGDAFLSFALRNLPVCSIIENFSLTKRIFDKSIFLSN